MSSTCVFQPKLNYKIYHLSNICSLADFSIIDLLFHSIGFFTLTIYADGKSVFVLAFKNAKLIAFNSKSITSRTIVQKLDGNSIHIKNPGKNLSLLFSYDKLTKFRYNNTLYKNLVITLRSYNL